MVGLADCTVENQELVLDVDNTKRVILARKEQGSRSQLWRMSSTGQLQHEGSSPPSHPNQPRTDNILVLDIEGPAPQPNTYTRLALRRPDPRRKSTQTWRFTEEGRLCCVHHNMCVQAQDGFFGLRQGMHYILTTFSSCMKVASLLFYCRWPLSVLATVYVFLYFIKLD